MCVSVVAEQQRGVVFRRAAGPVGRVSGFGSAADAPQTEQDSVRAAPAASAAGGHGATAQIQRSDSSPFSDNSLF